MRWKTTALILIYSLSVSCAGLLSKDKQSMVIHSEPGNATVYLNGNERGTTPYTYTYDRADGEDLTFELRLAGYKNATLSMRPSRANTVLFVDAMLLHLPYIVDSKSSSLYRLPSGEFHVHLFRNVPEDMQRQMVPVTTVDVSIDPKASLGTINNSRINMEKDGLFRDLRNGDQLTYFVVSGLKDTWMDARSVRTGTTKGDESIQRAKVFMRPKIKNISAKFTGDKYKPFGPMEMEIDWNFYSGSRPDSLLFNTNQKMTYNTLGGPANQVFSDALSQAARLMAEDFTLADKVASNYGNSLIATKGELITLVKPAAIPYNGRKDMLAALVKAVVTVRTEDGHGSGFMVTNDGYLITNEHVVGNETIVKVKFEQGFTLDAKVVKVNKDFDVALLKVTATDLPALTIGNDPGLMLGEEIFAIGTPMDTKLGQSVSRGVLSGRREIEGRNYLQTDVSINPGNSGGPLIDENGTVVGVATMKISGRGLEGLGFGVPISVALEMLNVDLKP